MTNQERDEMLKAIHVESVATGKAVVALQEVAHNPLTCARMATHEESHGRHVRWFFWTIAAVVGVGGLLTKIFGS